MRLEFLGFSIALIVVSLASPVAARMYQWADPNTGTAYLSGEPPSWYRTRQSGPRVLVYENGKLVDDTERHASLEREKALREQALGEMEVRKREEETRRAEEARLAAERVADEETEATPRVDDGEDIRDIFRSLVAEWDKKKPAVPPVERR